MTTLARSIQKLLPKELPPSLTLKPGNLYEILSKAPGGGVDTHVHQLRWGTKQISGSYWIVTRTKFKCDGTHGKAWGKLVWKGKPVSEREERIRGSLKYRWAPGQSKAIQPAEPSTAATATPSPPS